MIKNLVTNTTEDEKEIRSQIKRSDFKQIAYAFALLELDKDIQISIDEIPIKDITNLFYKQNVGEKKIAKTLDELREHGNFTKKVYVVEWNNQYHLIEGIRVLKTAELIGLKEIEVIISKGKRSHKYFKAVKRTYRDYYRYYKEKYLNEFEPLEEVV